MCPHVGPLDQALARGNQFYLITNTFRFGSNLSSSLSRCNLYYKTTPTEPMSPAIIYSNLWGATRQLLVFRGRGRYQRQYKLPARNQPISRHATGPLRWRSQGAFGSSSCSDPLRAAPKPAGRQMRLPWDTPEPAALPDRPPAGAKRSTSGGWLSLLPGGGSLFLSARPAGDGPDGLGIE